MESSEPSGDLFELKFQKIHTLQKIIQTILTNRCTFEVKSDNEASKNWLNLETTISSRVENQLGKHWKYGAGKTTIEVFVENKATNISVLVERWRIDVNEQDKSKIVKLFSTKTIILLRCISSLLPMLPLGRMRRNIQEETSLQVSFRIITDKGPKTASPPNVILAKKPVVYKFTSVRTIAGKLMVAVAYDPKLTWESLCDMLKMKVEYDTSGSLVSKPIEVKQTPHIVDEIPVVDNKEASENNNVELCSTSLDQVIGLFGLTPVKSISEEKTYRQRDLLRNRTNTCPRLGRKESLITSSIDFPVFSASQQSEPFVPMIETLVPKYRLKNTSSSDSSTSIASVLESTSEAAFATSTSSCAESDYYDISSLMHMCSDAPPLEIALTPQLEVPEITKRLDEFASFFINSILPYRCGEDHNIDVVARETASVK